jgi:predicted RNA-binding protein associated with RNAse of E/G family
MIAKYPDVVGMVSLSPNDAKRIRQNVPRATRKIRSYFKNAVDDMRIESVPEIILHPLAKRPAKDVIVSEKDVLENNYKLLRSIPVDSVEKMTTFMDEHAVYNPDTFFYNYKE